MAAPGTKPIEKPQLREILIPIAPVLVMVAIMWAVQVVNTALTAHLTRFGIRPRRLDGLDGIVFSPFLHAGFGHLIANTLPFLVLGAILAFSNTRRFLVITVIIAVVAGLGTWLFGRANTLTVGASGLVFGYLTCIVTRGIFARKLSYILGGLVVLIVYGGIFWGLVPTPGISWQDHLFGAIGGVVAAWFVYRRLDQARPAKPTPAAPVL